MRSKKWVRVKGRVAYARPKLVYILEGKRFPEGEFDKKVIQIVVVRWEEGSLGLVWLWNRKVSDVEAMDGNWKDLPKDHKKIWSECWKPLHWRVNTNWQ